MGEGVLWDSTNGVIPRLETTAAGATPSSDLPMSNALFFKRTNGVASNINFMGVLQEPCGAGKQGFIAGLGSLCTVKTTATALAEGNLVGSSTTAGLVAVQSTTALGVNCVLGSVIKVNTVAAPGTGSTGFAGIIVTCHGDRAAS